MAHCSQARSPRFLPAAVLAVCTAACTNSVQAPPVSGPSTFAQNISITATPDSLNEDGASQSSIQVLARNANAQPINGLPLQLAIFVQTANGVSQQDCGLLNAKTIVTGSDGKAYAVYTAPAPSGSAGCVGITTPSVVIAVTPTGTNAQADQTQTVTLRLLPVGVILPAPGTPVPRFIFSPASPSANTPVQFDGTSSCGDPLVGGACPSQTANKITSYAWTFGDGSAAASGATVSHSFAAAGNFSVSLTVTNDAGLAASTTQAVAVIGAALPTATFSFSPAAPGVGDTVFFNGSQSTAGAGHTLVSYKWAFGDGGTASGVTVSHQYTAAGTYNAQLVVTDEVGQSASSAPQTVAVGSSTTPGPTANFTFSPTGPVIGQAVLFDAASSSTGAGQTITSVAWDFGDTTPIVTCPNGSGCVGPLIVTHTYSVQGTYTVNMLVTDSAGRTASKNQTVPVSSGAPTAVLNVSKAGGTSVTADGTLSTATGTSSIVSYTFIWGDGTQTTQTTPVASHTFAAPVAPATSESFTITLRVTDNASPARSGTASQTITLP